MVKLWSRSQWMRRALVSNGIVALFLAQAFAIVFAAGERADFASRHGGPALAATAPFCKAVTHDDGPAPTPADRRHHCDMCPAACGGSGAGAAVAPTRLVDMLPPEAKATTSPRLVRAPAPFPPGWSSSWSSRAPPRA